MSTIGNSCAMPELVVGLDEDDYVFLRRRHGYHGGTVRMHVGRERVNVGDPVTIDGASGLVYPTRQTLAVGIVVATFDDGTAEISISY